MHCQTCGIPNEDDADTCVSCGADLREQRARAGKQPGLPPYTQPPVPAAPVGQPVSIPNYLVQSILVTLWCCLPAGIPAIVFAAQVDSKARIGDITGAMQASKNAKTWCWVAFGLGITLAVIQLVYLLAGVGSLFLVPA